MNFFLFETERKMEGKRKCAPQIRYKINFVVVTLNENYCISKYFVTKFVFQHICASRMLTKERMHSCTLLNLDSYY